MCALGCADVDSHVCGCWSIYSYPNTRDTDASSHTQNFLIICAGYLNLAFMPSQPFKWDFKPKLPSNSFLIELLHV